MWSVYERLWRSFHRHIKLKIITCDYKNIILVLPVATPHATPTIIENWTIEVRGFIKSNLLSMK